MDKPAFKAYPLVSMRSLRPDEPHPIAQVLCADQEVGTIYEDHVKGTFVVAVDEGIQPMLDEWLPQWVQGEQDRRKNERIESEIYWDKRELERRNLAREAVGLSLLTRDEFE